MNPFVTPGYWPSGTDGEYSPPTFAGRPVQDAGRDADGRLWVVENGARRYLNVVNVTPAAVTPWTYNSANQFLGAVTAPDGKVYPWVAVDKGGVLNAEIADSLTGIGAGGGSFMFGLPFGGQQRSQGRGAVLPAINVDGRAGFLLASPDATEIDTADKSGGILRNIVSEIGPIVAAAFAASAISGTAFAAGSSSAAAVPYPDFSSVILENVGSGGPGGASLFSQAAGAARTVNQASSAARAVQQFTGGTKRPTVTPSTPGGASNPFRPGSNDVPQH